MTLMTYEPPSAQSAVLLVRMSMDLRNFPSDITCEEDVVKDYKVVFEKKN